jgi:hypothetical protein
MSVDYNHSDVAEVYRKNLKELRKLKYSPEGDEIEIATRGVISALESLAAITEARGWPTSRVAFYIEFEAKSGHERI